MERDLTWLLGSVTVDEFIDRYFEKDMFHLADRGEGFYAPVFSLPDLDRIIHQSSDFIATHVRYSRAALIARRDHLPAQPQIPTPITPSTLSGSLLAAYEAGYSLIFDEIIAVWWPLARLARGIEAAVLGPVTATMFFSPPHSHGVSVHYDGFDVFILQISGCKDWKIYRPDTVLPIGPQPLGDIDLGAPIACLTMRPGDLLYLPRGFIHEAQSGDTASMHLTVGLHPYRWYELLADLVEGLAEREVALRQSVPIAVCRAIAAGAREGGEMAGKQLVALLQHCVANASLDAPVTRHARKFIDGLKPLELQSFTAPVPPDVLDSDQPVAKKPGMICYVYDTDDGKAVIGFPGGSIRGPRTIRPALEFIARIEGSFRAADLPGDLNLHSKSVLVLRLLREGLLCLPMTGGFA